jgi:hypothetical protein
MLISFHSFLFFGLYLLPQVVTTSFKKEPKILKIIAEVVVARESQKGILIGKKVLLPSPCGGYFVFVLLSQFSPFTKFKFLPSKSVIKITCPEQPIYPFHTCCFCEDSRPTLID